MTECEEVATTMLPHYLGYMQLLPHEHQGHSGESIRKYVLAQLSATESYVVIDNVTEHLQQLVLEHDGGTYK